MSILRELLVVILGLVGLAQCGMYTITDEAWFEVAVFNKATKEEMFRGRFTVGLFGDTAPMTAMNFVKLASGYTRGKETLNYANTPIHRIVPDFVIQMGDITRGDGTGGKSIYGEKFVDEEFTLSHRSPGWVAMANHGSDTNGSQFYILLTKARWLDGKHVVFGKVIRGFDTIRALGEVPSDPNTAVPEHITMIMACGVNELDRKYDLPQAYLDSEEDLD